MIGARVIEPRAHVLQHGCYWFPQSYRDIARIFKFCLLVLALTSLSISQPKHCLAPFDLIEVPLLYNSVLFDESIKSNQHAGSLQQCDINLKFCFQNYTGKRFVLLHLFGHNLRFYNVSVLYPTHAAVAENSCMQSGKVKQSSQY